MTQPGTVRHLSYAGVMLTMVSGALGVWGCGPAAGASQRSQSSDTKIIAGGPFEASGVAHVPGTNFALFVDDGRTRELFLMALTATGEQAGAAETIPLGADVTDIEGITSDGRFFYVVGSQSKKKGAEGDGLVRFTFDAAARRITGVERVQGLKGWLAANVPELRGAAQRSGDDVLNIEAIAWDPRGQRLLLGLRAPVVDGRALVVPIALKDPSGNLSRDNLKADGPAIRLDLGGAGIRSLEYFPRDNAFRVVAGASLNDEDRDFQVLRWDGGTNAPQEIATWPRELKAEGVTPATIDGRSFSVTVFDVGRFSVVADSVR